MRLVLTLLVVLAISIALIVFPDIADQALRVEAFGWVFETRQGAFIVAFLLLLFVLWLMRSLIAALFAGPGMAWRSLRMGSRKRREKNLKEALAQCLDQRGDSGLKAFKRSRGMLPDWSDELLRTMVTPAHRLPSPAEQQNKEPLSTVLAARIATDPHAEPKLDLDLRKAHLDAWLAAHPGAPLAVSRRSDLAEEDGEWLYCTELLEAELKHGQRPATQVHPRLVHAYLELTKQEPKNATLFLRKAYQLQPENEEVLLAYGRSLVAGDDAKTAQRLWSGHLERISSDAIAAALLELLRGDGMHAYRKLENKKASAMNHAQRWLRAELAHAAHLDGLAFEQMQALADETGSKCVWQSLGAWYQAAKKYEQAATCLRAACEAKAS